MVAYDEHYITDIISITNTATELMNRLYKYRLDNSMQDDCILDVIKEFCYEYNYSLEDFGSTISEDDAYINIISADIDKFGYLKKIKN